MLSQISSQVRAWLQDSEVSGIGNQQLEQDQEDMRFPVRLNVYERHVTINRCLRWLCLGFFHSSVQVHGQEYMFSASEDLVEPGIQSGADQQLACREGLNLCRSIIIGHTPLDLARVASAVDRLENQFTGNSYNLFFKNSSHFSNRLCETLTGNPIPCWVDPIVFLGRFWSCILKKLSTSSADDANAYANVPVADDDLDDNDHDNNGHDERSSSSDYADDGTLWDRVRRPRKEAGTSSLQAFDQGKETNSTSSQDNF